MQLYFRVLRTLTQAGSGPHHTYLDAEGARAQGLQTAVAAKVKAAKAESPDAQAPAEAQGERPLPLQGRGEGTCTPSIGAIPSSAGMGCSVADMSVCEGGEKNREAGNKTGC